MSGTVHTASEVQVHIRDKFDTMNKGFILKTSFVFNGQPPKIKCEPSYRGRLAQM